MFCNNTLVLENVTLCNQKNSASTFTIEEYAKSGKSAMDIGKGRQG
jgi:hypothetical protein